MAEEAHHLGETVALLRAARQRALELLQRTDEGYNDTKRYMSAYRGEIDPDEMYQNELVLKDIDQQGAQAHETCVRLDKLLDSPYFARIDFAADERGAAGGGAPEEALAPTPFYIGRFSFSHENAMVVSDWRSPIAGLFYEYDETGPAAYDAPAGRVSGTLVRKRQLGIEHGKLLFAQDTSSAARDEVLARELGKTSDAKMRSIIASIQAEQNRIIRDETPGTLVIQGVAGSGKTSIALHRVAYLLYRRKGTLSSKSVAILSPNKVFADYIAGVLPELGEEPILEFDLRDVAQAVLGSAVAVAAPRTSLDDADEAWGLRACHKGSAAFAQAVGEYLEGIFERIFVARNLEVGRRTVEASWLDRRFRSYGNLPVNERLDALAADVMADAQATSFGRARHALPTKREVRRKLAGMLVAADALSLYRRFLLESGHGDLFAAPAKGVVEWEDACPLVLFQTAFAPIDRFSDVKHLVVDEMQDLSPVQHLMMSRLFCCEKTLLGDYHQMVDYGNAMELGSVGAFYDDARVVTLTRSYRSTYEIAMLANKVKPVPGLEVVNRHGEAPRILRCENTAAILECLQRAIEAFAASGHKTLGILHASDMLAQRYFELLPEEAGAHLLAADATTFEDGVSVASIKMAKGLEFDEVVILDADARFYSTDFERNLLYVAITRAMHRLTVLHRGDLTSFLQD